MLHRFYWPMVLVLLLHTQVAHAWYVGTGYSSVTDGRKVPAIHGGFVPTLGFFEPGPDDVDWDEEYAKTHTITIKTEAPTAGGLAGGDALPKLGSSGNIVSCTIQMPTGSFTSAWGHKSTLTHELVHCMGIGHDHEDTGSIMSYNSIGKKTALTEEEKMALTFSYPLDPDYSAESASLGLACSPAQ